MRYVVANNVDGIWDGYVAGVVDDGGIEFTRDIAGAVRFGSRDAALGFIERYADRGFGLSSRSSYAVPADGDALPSVRERDLASKERRLAEDERKRARNNDFGELRVLHLRVAELHENAAAMHDRIAEYHERREGLS